MKEISLKDIALVLSKFKKQSLKLSILELSKKMKKLLKPSRQAQKSMKELGIKQPK